MVFIPSQSKHGNVWGSLAPATSLSGHLVGSQVPAKGCAAQWTRLQPSRELSLQLTLQLQTKLPALNRFLNGTVKRSFTVTIARPFNELQVFGIVLKNSVSGAITFSIVGLNK